MEMDEKSIKENNNSFDIDIQRVPKPDQSVNQSKGRERNS